MHILQLTDLYTPVIGGLERHVATLSAELQRLGHTVTVVTLRPGDLPAEEVVDGVRVVRIRSLTQRIPGVHASASHPFHPTAPDPAAIAALRRVVRDERPDVVHSHSWLQYSFFPLYHPKKGPAHVVTMHDYGIACPRKTMQPSARSAQCAGPGLGKCLTCAPAQYGAVKGTVVAGLHLGSRFLNRHADRYIAVSNAVARQSAQVLAAGEEIAVLPTMIPDGLYEVAAATPRPAFLPADDGYLIFIGALGPHKGVDVLLQAHRRMRHKLPLVLLGIPRPDSPPLDRPNVTVVKNVPHAEAMAALHRSSIVVVPSVWREPLGRVAVEGMLLGRPVVASNVGGLMDFIEDGVTGVLVSPGDAEALTRALDVLLDNPDLRARMGQAGQLRARRFEASAITPRIIEVFEGALRDRSKT